MELILLMALPLFLIENIFKGNLNNLHSCVGNKQKQRAYVTVKTCVHTLAKCATRYAGMPSTVFFPPFFWSYL